METARSQSVVRSSKTKRVLSDQKTHRHVAHREPETGGIRRALQALAIAYARAGTALRDRLEDARVAAHEIDLLGSSFGWVTDRQRLVHTFLAAEPAVIAYAYANISQPEQIATLAETAAELAGEHQSLISALGLLGYIERELGWTSVGAAPLGSA
jgi:hypothetical protein